MSETNQSEAAVKSHHKVVPLKEKIAFGMGDLPAYLPTHLTTYLANQVFNMSLGVSPTLISLVMAIFRLVDAFTDPLVGWLSDRFRSRFGRRRPFMFVGMILSALTVPLVYLVNPDWSSYQIMSWYLVVGLVLLFFNTLFSIPFGSLGLEMTPDYDERTSITAWRSFISKVTGLSLGWIWYITQLPIFADPETGSPDTLRGAQGISLIFALLILIFGSVTVFSCKERYYTSAKSGKSEPLINSFKLTLRCKPFLTLLALMFVFGIGDLVRAFSYYLNTYYIYDGSQKDAAYLFGWQSTLTTVLGFACIPLLVWVSKKLGKERTLLLVFSTKIVTSLAYAYAYANPHMIWLLFIPSITWAPMYAGLFMIVPSMLADVVDYDELKTGERREGTFASIFSWVFKLSSTLMFGLSGPMLDLMGFRVADGAQQADGVFLTMVVSLCVVPAIGAVGAIVFLGLYKLNRETAESIRKQLEARRGEIS